ncbi:MAG TPA: hypothetical protein VMH38_01710, partial [Thermoplasmata archaeon]|nr:hypothetical protein [Thermoplasmata archaeon]
EARGRHDYSRALSILEDAERQAREAAHSKLELRLTELKNRIWVGERLGLDTTPAMELFGEARLGLDQGQFPEAAHHIEQGNEALARLLRERIDSRLGEVATELGFARDGLRVSLGNLEERLAKVPKLIDRNEIAEAGRLLIGIEEELAQRKSQHRELMNLHYLIDAALGRAADQALDTSEAERLLSESLRGRSTDYADAIAKAHASLKLLEGLLRAAEPPTSFWPFRRPPPGAQ